MKPKKRPARRQSDFEPILPPVMRATEGTVRPKKRPKSIEDDYEAQKALDRAYRSLEREDMDAPKFRDGGMVRSAGRAQISGKRFSGLY